MRKAWGVILIIVMLALSVLFLGLSGLLKMPSVASSFPHLKSLYLNRKANQQFQSQNYQSAFDQYVQILEFDPFSPEIHLNLGLTFEAQQQPEKAMSSYQNSMNYAKDPAMKFVALFNQAQLLGKGKKIDEALELYQKALEIDPASKEVKTNIELLIQQQQSGGKGGDDNKDQKDKKDQKDNKDQQNKGDGKDKKDQQQNKGDNQDQNKDQNKDQKDDQNKDQKKDKDRNQGYANNKPQPHKFKSEDLSEGDVKKILGEIKQQEQKIRAEFNRKETKEQPRDKDW